MNVIMKRLLCIGIILSMFFFWSSVVVAENYTPDDCLACHQADIHSEHNPGIGCSNCHTMHGGGTGDPDIDETVNLGLGGGTVHCAFCHETEVRTIHLHDDGLGNIEHDHATVPLSCGYCHGFDLKSVHIDRDENDLGVKLTCYTCHSGTGQPGTDPQVRAAVDQGLAGDDIACSACHLGYHLDDHDHAVIPPGNCIDCHSDNVVTEHLDNHGLECQTCHSSTDQVVLDAINAGVGPNGSDVDCFACHPNADHSGAHDHAVISSPDCLNCHSANVVTEHVSNHGLSCATCHSSTDQVVIDAIAAGSGPAGTDVDCNVCHGDVDHSTAHDQVYLLTRENGVLVNITSTDDPADGTYDNLPPFRPSETCGACHRQVADNHWGNFHSGLRMSELLDQQGNPSPVVPGILFARGF